MKNIVKTTVVLAIVALFCGLLIGATHALTIGTIEKNSEKRANAVYLEYFKDLDKTEVKEVDGQYVYQVLTVKDENGNALGYIFKGKDNNDFGLIDIIVAADLSGKILGAKVLETKNTPGIYDKHINDDNSLKAVRGDNVSNLEGVDKQAGATVTGGSLNNILNEVRQIAPDYMDVETELYPYQILFGEDTIAETDSKFKPTDLVTDKEIIKDADGIKLGYTYTATNYREIHRTPDAELTLVVGVDLDGKVIGIVEKVNEHTQTENFYLKYADDLANLKDIDVVDLNIDKQAGATVSHDALTELFEAIKNVYEIDSLEIHEQLFGKGATAEEDSSFTPTELITKKEIIKDVDGVELGYTYTATNYREIHRTPDAELTLVVGINLDGKVVGIAEKVNQHTQSENFYLKYADDLASLKNIDVADLNIDEKAGATISHGALTELFEAIKEAEGL